MKTYNYYTKQLECLKTKLPYAVTVQFRDADGNKTNWMDINIESIPALIDYLEKVEVPIYE